MSANGSATAQEILRRLVAGTQETVEPELAAEAALKSLTQRGGRAREDLLFSVITFPEQTAAANRKAIDHGKLRAIALAWVRESASEAFRLRLANSMMAADTPAVACEQIWTALGEARVENLAAQVAMYRSGRLADGAVESLERQFAEQSRAELRRLLGCIPSEQSHPVSDGTDPTGASCRAAKLLWTPDFAGLVEQRLREAEGSERGSRVLSLAGTIPSFAMRAAVLQSLKQYWEDGPARVEPFAASDESLPEPGFLLLVKQLPRKDVPATSANGGGGEGSGTSRLPSGKAAKIAAARQFKDRQDRIAQQWLAFSERLAQAMCRRFKETAFRHPESQEPPADFPIKLPASAAVVASHRAEWPEGLPAALAELRLPSLRVHYVRIERRARPDKVLAYFRHQLPSAARRVNDRGVWLDDFSMDRKRRSLRSVDVFISKPNKDVGMLLDQEQQVIVELLAVESLSQADN